MGLIYGNRAEHPKASPSAHSERLMGAKQKGGRTTAVSPSQKPGCLQSPCLFTALATGITQGEKVEEREQWVESVDLEGSARSEQRARERRTEEINPICIHLTSVMQQPVL